MQHTLNPMRIVTLFSIVIMIAPPMSALAPRYDIAVDPAVLCGCSASEEIYVR